MQTFVEYMAANMCGQWVNVFFKSPAFDEHNEPFYAVSTQITLVGVDFMVCQDENNNIALFRFEDVFKIVSLCRSYKDELVLDRVEHENTIKETHERQ